jgi:hypothetical protein
MKFKNSTLFIKSIVFSGIILLFSHTGFLCVSTEETGSTARGAQYISVSVLNLKSTMTVQLFPDGGGVAPQLTIEPAGTDESGEILPGYGTFEEKIGWGKGYSVQVMSQPDYQYCLFISNAFISDANTIGVNNVNRIYCFDITVSSSLVTLYGNQQYSMYLFSDDTLVAASFGLTTGVKGAEDKYFSTSPVFYSVDTDGCRTDTEAILADGSYTLYAFLDTESSSSAIKCNGVNHWLLGAERGVKKSISVENQTLLISIDNTDRDASELEEGTITLEDLITETVTTTSATATGASYGTCKWFDESQVSPTFNTPGAIGISSSSALVDGAGDFSSSNLLQGTYSIFCIGEVDVNHWGFRIAGDWELYKTNIPITGDNTTSIDTTFTEVSTVSADIDIENSGAPDSTCKCKWFTSDTTNPEFDTPNELVEVTGSLTDGSGTMTKVDGLLATGEKYRLYCHADVDGDNVRTAGDFELAKTYFSVDSAEITLSEAFTEIPAE